MARSFFTASSKRLAFGVTVILVPVFVFLTMASLRISHVECQTTTGSCPPELVSQLEDLKGRWAFLGESSIQTQVRTDTSYYQVTSIKRQLPGTLILKLEKQSSAYQLRAQQSPDIKTISQTGLVIEGQTDSQLPSLILAPGVWQDFWAEGKPNALYHQKLLHVFQAVKTSNLSSRALYLVDHQTLALYLTNGQVALLDIDEFGINLERLQLVERSLTSQPHPEMQEIDVRYQLPVLRPTLSVPRHEAL